MEAQLAVRDLQVTILEVVEARNVVGCREQGWRICRVGTAQELAIETVAGKSAGIEESIAAEAAVVAVTVVVEGSTAAAGAAGAVIDFAEG